jgi:hypothetical protein
LLPLLLGCWLQAWEPREGFIIIQAEAGVAHLLLLNHP